MSLDSIYVKEMSTHISIYVWYVSLEWNFIYLLLFLASVHGFMYETSDFFTL